MSNPGILHAKSRSMLKSKLAHSAMVKPQLRTQPPDVIEEVMDACGNVISV